MKLAYSVGTPDAKGPLMAFSGDFEVNVRDIKRIGYQALELFVREPNEMDPSVGKIIESSGLAVAAVGSNPAMSQDGLTLLSTDDQVRKEAVARVQRMVDFGAVYGAPVCIGKYRGQLWKGDEESAWKELEKAFTQICNHATKRGMKVMLEPQNAFNINNLNTCAQAVQWIEKNGFDNLELLYDTFHGDLAEVSVAAGVLGAQGKIGFVHCSDSNRLPAGAGHIDMADAFAALKAVGYDGYVSMEIAQRPDSYTGAELCFKTVDYILKYVI